jgi:hypothetical protein
MSLLQSTSTGCRLHSQLPETKGIRVTIRTCNHCAARRTAAILSEALDCLFPTAIIRREREQIRNLECEAWPGSGVLV